jgi:hypothetical protein
LRLHTLLRREGWRVNHKKVYRLYKEEKLELRREYAMKHFDRFHVHVPYEKRADYWGEVEVLYVPYYAYEEILATFGDSPGKLNTLLAATERLTVYLTGGEVRQWAAPTKAECKEIRAYYEDTSPSEGRTLGVPVKPEDKAKSFSEEAR